MANKYQQKVSALIRFNDWEAEYEAMLSEEERCLRFLHLFDLGMKMPLETIASMQKQHLESLVQVQQCLRQKKRKSG